MVVPAPAFTPSQYGLLSVAEDRTAIFDANPNTSHWGAGIIWQPLCPDGSTTYDECLTVTGAGAPPPPPAKDTTFDNVRQAATPFTVYVRKDCSIPTFWDEATGQITESLTESEAFEVEQAFWTGQAGAQGVVFPHLADDTPLVVDRDTLQLAADVVDTGGAVDIVQAFGALEQAAVECMRGAVVLHVTVAAAAALIAWDQITARSGVYYTALGNKVAIGAGYTGSSPAGVASTPASTWMYATGPVFYARGPLMDPSPVQSVGLSTNSMEMLAERTYVVGYSCCLLAVETDLTLTICCPA